MHIVTAGTAYIDIDAYGASIALAELLRLQGEDALAASTAPCNASVPPSLQKLGLQFETQYRPSAGDVFTIVDLSDPKHFDFGANVQNVIGVIDHHLGFQDFWQGKLGTKAHIEFIGAACTIVYELWRGSGLLEKMSSSSATVLACGILDNTLNLKARITTTRDTAAYAQLAKHAKLPADWPARYFSECQQYITTQTRQALANDAKIIHYPGQPLPLHVGQLALWEAPDFLRTFTPLIREVLGTQGQTWFMNLIDIHSGKSIFFCEDEALRAWLAKLLGVSFMGATATADRMWLRKEIFKRASDKHVP